MLPNDEFMCLTEDNRRIFLRHDFQSLSSGIGIGYGTDVKAKGSNLNSLKITHVEPDTDSDSHSGFLADKRYLNANSTNRNSTSNPISSDANSERLNSYEQVHSSVIVSREESCYEKFLAQIKAVLDQRRASRGDHGFGDLKRFNLEFRSTLKKEEGVEEDEIFSIGHPEYKVSALEIRVVSDTQIMSVSDQVGTKSEKNQTESEGKETSNKKKKRGRNSAIEIIDQSDLESQSRLNQGTSINDSTTIRNLNNKKEKGFQYRTPVGSFRLQVGFILSSSSSKNKPIASKRYIRLAELDLEDEKIMGSTSLDVRSGADMGMVKGRVEQIKEIRISREGLLGWVGE